MKIIKHSFLFFFFCLLFFSCSKNSNLSSCTAKYSSDIRPIILAKCALSSCHVSGTSLPNLSVYSVVKANADNGRIMTNVFDLKIMPPANSAQLTDAEKEKFKCWLDNGALQN